EKLSYSRSEKFSEDISQVKKDIELKKIERTFSYKNQLAIFCGSVIILLFSTYMAIQGGAKELFKIAGPNHRFNIPIVLVIPLCVVIGYFSLVNMLKTKKRNHYKKRN